MSKSKDESHRSQGPKRQEVMLTPIALERVLDEGYTSLLVL